MMASHEMSAPNYRTRIPKVTLTYIIDILSLPNMFLMLGSQKCNYIHFLSQSRELEPKRTLSLPN